LRGGSTRREGRGYAQEIQKRWAARVRHCGQETFHLPDVSRQGRTFLVSEQLTGREVYRRRQAHKHVQGRHLSPPLDLAEVARVQLRPPKPPCNLGRCNCRHWGDELDAGQQTVYLWHFDEGEGDVATEEAISLELQIEGVDWVEVDR
jgi:hypothetical protein